MSTNDDDQVDLCEEQPLKLVKERRSKPKSRLDELLDDLNEMDRSKRFKSERSEGCSKAEADSDLSKTADEPNGNSELTENENGNDILQKFLEQRLMSNLVRVNKRAVDELDEESDEEVDNEEDQEDASSELDNGSKPGQDDSTSTDDEDNCQSGSGGFFYENLLNNSLVSNNLLSLLKKRFQNDEDNNGSTSNDSLNNLNDNLVESGNLMNLISLNNLNGLNALPGVSSNSLSDGLTNNSLLNLNSLSGFGSGPNSGKNSKPPAVNGKQAKAAKKSKKNNVNNSNNLSKSLSNSDTFNESEDDSSLQRDLLEKCKSSSFNFNGKQLDLGLIQNLLFKVI